MGVILWELLLTRIYSVVLYYHFAFMAVSVAMFGLTLGAIYVQVRPKQDLSALAFLAGLLMAVSISVQLVLPLRFENRSVPAGAYVIYRSSSLRANVGQPTWTSKLCLSCHDGTIALGSVLSRPSPITFAGGGDRIPPGSTNLGTDLSDDHPISFVYPSSSPGGGSRR